MVADRGWCSAAFVADIRNGEVDGTNVSGSKVALAADFPSGFLAGNGTGSRFHDPDMREWTSGGHAEQGDFYWSA
jgi:hypothetical protein